MGDNAQHPREALQDLLDDRLNPSTRGELEIHLASRQRCRSELAATGLPRHGKS